MSHRIKLPPPPMGIGCQKSRKTSPWGRQTRAFFGPREVRDVWESGGWTDRTLAENLPYRLGSSTST